MLQLASGSAASEEERVLAWGANVHGALGLRSKRKEELPQPAAVAELAGLRIVDIACAHFHAAAIVDTLPGQIFTWGRGTLGVLGHGDEEECLLPRPVGALRGVPLCTVSCGPYHMAAASRAGELFCWGWRLEAAEDGVLEESYSAIPRREAALGAVHVRAVSCGHYSTAALGMDGSLFTWGKGSRGQLGHGDERDVAEPAAVRALARSFVWEARCGKGFMLCLTRDGQVFSHGDNSSGALGQGVPAASGALGRAESAQLAPRRLEALRGVCAIACGDAHCAALASGGEGVYTWGSARHGRLGLSAAALARAGVDANGRGDVVWTPALVEALEGKRCVRLACGTFHTLCLTASGHVWTCGGRSAEALRRVRLGGACALLACGGHHCLAATAARGVEPLGEADVALALELGLRLPAQLLAVSLPPGQQEELAPPLAELLDQRVSADADPSRVAKELVQLRELLASEEAKRDKVHAQLLVLQQQLQQALLDEELMREQRSQGLALLPPASEVPKGMALLSEQQYASLLPEEQAEVSVFGLRMGVALTAKQS